MDALTRTAPAGQRQNETVDRDEHLHEPLATSTAHDAYQRWKGVIFKISATKGICAVLLLRGEYS